MADREELDRVHHHLYEAALALANIIGSIAPAETPKLLQIVEAITTAQRLLLELGRVKCGV
jgi:hypothetical protein